MEGVGHAASDDDVIGLLDEVPDEGDLIGDLGAAEDREKWALRVLEHGCKGSQFLLDQEARHLVGKLDSGDARVGAVGGTEGVVHVDVGELAEAGAEGGHLGGISLHAVPFGILGLALFLDMETDILEQDDLAGFQGGAGGLDLGSDAVVEELHRLAEQFLQLCGDGLEGVLGDALAVGAAEMAGQDDRRTLIQGVLDGRKRRGDALGIGDLSGLLVLGDVEVNADEDAFAGEVEVLDRFLGHGDGN